MIFRRRHVTGDLKIDEEMFCGIQEDGVYCLQTVFESVRAIECKKHGRLSPSQFLTYADCIRILFTRLTELENKLVTHTNS